MTERYKFSHPVKSVSDGLTIYNASSTHYALTAMSYVALMIPLVLAYMVYVWYCMVAKKISVAEVT